MAITNGYATLAEYKTYISMRGLAGSVGTDASDDAVIEILIESASRFIERYIGRKFWKDSSDTDYYYTAENSNCVLLPDFASITTVSVDYNNTRTYTDLTASDWEALPKNYSAEGTPIREIAILPTSSSYFATYTNAVKVTGKRGWAAVPTDIKNATLEIVNNIYSSRSGQASSGKFTITASGVVLRPEDIPEYARITLQQYRFIT